MTDKKTPAKAHSRRRLYDQSAEITIKEAVSSEYHEIALKMKDSEARHIVKSEMVKVMGAGLIPIPLVDMAAIALINMAMIRKLAAFFEVDYAENQAKSIIASLTMSVSSEILVRGSFASYIKAIPFVGAILGTVSLSILAGANTYALGMVFMMHFESGGTLLNFNAADMRAHYETSYQEGKLITQQMA